MYSRKSLLAGLCGAVLLAGCGGGTGGNGSGGDTPGSLSGTAATGAPIAGATIVVEDASGGQVTGTTDSGGHYRLEASTLKPPFLVKVTTASGALYGVSADASPSVVNVTPLTDLILRGWYAVQSTPVEADTAFADPGSHPPPSVTEVAVIEHVVRQVAALWLQKYGVDPSTFNLISTAFDADGTGADKALDHTSVTFDLTAGGGSVKAKDDTTSQDTTVSFDPLTATVKVSTTTTSGNATSTSAATSIIPSSDSASQVLAGIQSSLDAFAQTVTARGTNLTAADLLPFVATTALNEGLNRDQFAAEAASNFAGGVTLAFHLLSVDALDTATSTATATFQVNVTKSGQTRSETVQFQFVEQDGHWLINGDQRYVSAGVQAEERLDQGAQAGAMSPKPRFDINVDISSPQGILSGTPTVTGTGFSPATPMSAGSQIVDTFGSLTIRSDHYFANTGSITPPAAGSPVDVDLMANGTPTTYHFVTNAVTNEPVTITGGSGAKGAMDSTLGSIALGSALTLGWTLPATYPIASVKLEALVYDGDQTLSATHQCNVRSDGVLAATATTGSVTIPATCDGSPVKEVNLNLSVTGANGERSLAIWFLQ